MSRIASDGTIYLSDADRVVLVTGASSGFGRLTVSTLAGKGFRVFGTSRQLGRARKAEEEAQKAAEKIEIDNVIDRVKELMETPINFTNKQAYEVVAAERGKIPTTRNIQQFDIPETVTGPIRDVVERILSRRP